MAVLARELAEALEQGQHERAVELQMELEAAAQHTDTPRGAAQPAAQHNVAPGQPQPPHQAQQPQPQHTQHARQPSPQQPPQPQQSPRRKAQPASPEAQQPRAEHRFGRADFWEATPNNPTGGQHDDEVASWQELSPVPEQDDTSSVKHNSMSVKEEPNVEEPKSYGIVTPSGELKSLSATEMICHLHNLISAVDQRLQQQHYGPPPPSSPPVSYTHLTLPTKRIV
eukprot:TRINITY_DN6830_c0_g1_i6.p2 TRINITY_DN6830_c0_g1~~TRINITY_DN6830_c0_g1_i6.p2  ORF type:complete len:226 (-),score=60.36 TRINITY_DN6830_c0_g1_i6:85-762(-)